MGFFDMNEKLASNKTDKGDSESLQLVEIKMPDCEGWVPISKFQIKRIYEDDIGPRLLLILDECAEIFQKTKLKTVEGKEEDAMKDEIQGHLQSITQLGRSSGIHAICCTQRNDTSTINGTIQNNPLSLKTETRFKRATS